METKKQVKKTEIKTIRKDYIFLVNFTKQIKNLDLNQETNTAKIKELYLAESKNKVFSNFSRVFKRSLRAEILPQLQTELSQANLTLQEYKEINYKVAKLADTKSASKYIQVTIKE